ncbi:MAG TPA: glycosyltransferase family 4 protein [Candidatus Paceibacterota bacterium]|nr:glycosyltransferase family 4 protein [Candidatus Paceibacterota bacterium]
MKLLVITQKIDLNDPVLGFFHRWVEEFAKKCEFVTVICLEKGQYNLPQNVKVLSLGKEKKLGRLAYLWNFYKYLWQERNNYDSVFVHMNQEYVLLGGLVWKLLGKNILMWRNHAKGNFLTRLAVCLSDKVFCTSPQSFTARFKKTKLMPVGIDTDFFCPNPSAQKIPNSILFLGRIAPVKNVDAFIEALNELNKTGTNFFVTIAGGALPVDAEYEKKVKDKVEKYGLKDKVRFIGPVTQVGALELYQKHELYVNLTPAGSLDKTIFEAMACDVASLVYNRDLAKIVGGELLITVLIPLEVARRIKTFLLGKRKEVDYRSFAVKEHSLEALTRKFKLELLN